MEITKQAVAGTVESSDVLVEMSPAEGELQIDLESPVKAQFGESILKTVEEVLKNEGVSSGKVKLQDHGALDCTIRARVLACLHRASGEEEAKHA